MIHIASGAVAAACVWAVLNPRLHTRTLGTLALSLLGILATIVSLS